MLNRPSATSAASGPAGFAAKAASDGVPPATSSAAASSAPEIAIEPVAAIAAPTARETGRDSSALPA